jgi:hypothetical protein
VDACEHFEIVLPVKEKSLEEQMCRLERLVELDGALGVSHGGVDVACAMRGLGRGGMVMGVDGREPGRKARVTARE